MLTPPCLDHTLVTYVAGDPTGVQSSPILPCSCNRARVERETDAKTCSACQLQQRSNCLTRPHVMNDCAELEEFRLLQPSLAHGNEDALLGCRQGC